MLLINCPYCGNRPEIEFAYGGEAHITRAPQEATDKEWTAFLYQRGNARGEHAERWRHQRGCGRFFNAVRNTVTDHFITTYKTGEQRP